MCGDIFGSSDSTVTTKLPDFMEAAGEDITQRARGIADQPYQAYTGQRYAPLSQNQQFATNYASQVAGAEQDKVDAASNYFDQSARSMTDMDVASYMNPYLQNVMNPQAQKMDEAYGKLQNDISDQAVAAGAFGGSRHGIREGEMDDDRMENMMQLYGQGYANAYDNATNLITNEFGRQNAAGSGMLQSAGTESGLVTDDMNRLLTTGGVEQGHAQQQKDFDYGQFVEGRDWEINRLMPYISAIGGIPYGTSTTQPGASPFSQAAGAGLSLAGLFV